MYSRQRRVFQSVLIILLGVLSLAVYPISANDEVLHSYDGIATYDEDGLQLSNFKIFGPSPWKEGDTVTVEFDLKNTTRKPIYFGSRGIFTGCLNPNGGKEDFGHQFQKKGLLKGETVHFKAAKKLGKKGTWTFWPSYYLGATRWLNHRSGYGLYKWQAVEINPSTKSVTLILPDNAQLDSFNVKQNMATVSFPNYFSAYHQGYLVGRIEAIRRKYDVPALAAAIVIGGQIVAQAATGVRRLDSEEKVLVSDAFQIGSITKTMTATLFAVLLDKGCFEDMGYPGLTWDTTLGDFYNDDDFPNFWEKKVEEYKNVTIGQLFAHLGRFPGGPKSSRVIVNASSLKDQRHQYVKAAVSDEPLVENLTYSAGAVIVASIMEHVMEQSWEELMREYVFEPMGMNTSGFGAMSSKDVIDGVWEHIHNVRNHRIYGYLVPNENYAALVDAPAGPNLHCSVIDMAKYLSVHLTNKNPVNKSDFFEDKDKGILEKMHEKVNESRGHFCYGAWALHEKERWFKDKEIDYLNHSGSNNRNLALSRIFFTDGVDVDDFAICMMCNAANTAAKDARIDLVEELIQMVEHWSNIPELDNSLALGKTTTAFNDTTGGYHYAERATDGMLSTRWLTNRAFTDEPFWIKVDLGSVKSIGKIIVFEEFEKRVRKFEIQYSIDGNNWVTVWAGNQIGFNLIIDLEAEGKNFESRFVRLIITEVEIIEKKPKFEISEFLLYPPANQ